MGIIEQSACLIINLSVFIAMVSSLAGPAMATLELFSNSDRLSVSQ